MPIVNLYCRPTDELGKEVSKPQIFLKVKGMMFRTPFQLTDIWSYQNGWTGYRTSYGSQMDSEEKEQLRSLAEKLLSQPDSELKKKALDPTGLKFCGQKFIL